MYLCVFSETEMICMSGCQACHMLHGIRVCPTIPVQHTTPTGAILQVQYTPIQPCEVTFSAFQAAGRTEHSVL
jgi:hypothetical protein